MIFQYFKISYIISLILIESSRSTNQVTRFGIDDILKDTFGNQSKKNNDEDEDINDKPNSQQNNNLKRKNQDEKNDTNSTTKKICGEKSIYLVKDIFDEYGIKIFEKFKNVKMGLVSDLDLHVFLKVFVEYQNQNFTKQKPYFLINSRYYYFSSNNSLPVCFYQICKYDYDTWIFEYFARVLVLKSKIFNIKLIINGLNKIKSKDNVISNLDKDVYFDSLINPDGLFDFEYIDIVQISNQFISEVFNSYSRYALTNETADINFISKITNRSVLTGHEKNSVDVKSFLNNLFKNEKYHLVKYKDMAIVRENKTMPTNATTESFVETVNERTINDSNKESKPLFNNLKLLIKIFNKEEIKKRIYQIIFDKLKIRKTSTESYKYEWIPKIYEYVTNEDFIKQFISYYEYVQSIITDIETKKTSSSLFEESDDLLILFDNLNNKDLSMDKMNELISDFTKYFEKEKLNLSQAIDIWIENSEIDLEKKRSIYYCFKLFENIFLKTFDFYTSIMKIYLEIDNNLVSIIRCINLPEYMLLFIFNPNSFEKVFSRVANWTENNNNN